MISRVCEQCGAIFQIPQAWIRKGGGRFCSYRCMGNSKLATPESFWEQVDRSGNADACWPWLGAGRSAGYGAVKYQGRQWRTHRLAWFLTNGPIPSGLLVCHSCDNPLCCRPSHLWLGTIAENNADKVAKGRQTVGDHVPPQHRRRGDNNGARRFPDRLKRGSASTRSKLTEADVAAIRRAYAEKTATVRELAVRYGMRREHLYKIIRRELWQHVP